MKARTWSERGGFHWSRPLAAPEAEVSSAVVRLLARDLQSGITGYRGRTPVWCLPPACNCVPCLVAPWSCPCMQQCVARTLHP